MTSLYDWSYWFCEAWLVPLITPLLYFQEHIMPPFSNPAGDMARWMESDPGLNILAWTIAVNVALMIGFTNVIIVVYLERKIAGRIMDRRGPMLSLNSLKEIASDLAGYAPEYTWKTTTYAGIGILQNVADGIKFFCKEIIVPDKADRLLYTIGPVIFISSSILLLVMVPFSPRIAASSAPLGLLVVMAAFSIAPIGVLTTGWACNNKYTLIGGMRSAAQLMAYEIPLLLSMAGVFLVAGSYNPMDIVAQQQGMWNVVPQFLGFIVFIVCMLAEVERVPFDLPEAEAELVEGWTTEIGGLRLGLVFAAEYIRGFVGAMIATILFLGGWSGPFLPGEIWFLLKVYGILIFFIILRWTVPRIRTDQILLLGWKRLLPLSLINLALAILYVEVF
ncbi:MAG: NADH-quinone oxidoreductase subunit H [Euryarchaeota archaeon]|jgi:NADH-quinone oxidoreductase subunit H|nr:NADH-quinone oxidoreductase subunit H [Euryarchaeota archaeon]MDP7136302.1 NADH-quinone oxidoreductase subunit H [Candidatus Poseidoniia archaeon]MDP7590430.1 NADH-quinone oxidoreductase subunit H [Candidatus Poseidoniia archaeon]MDP7607647.1 NADH-quinone oxidoreductase subunit H [Candidatus Poseidoniia archaeon]HJP43944.1 complex I subunit 1 family protein [Candidatus Poseidoniia archaeon]|tara:strand:+ start:976 stop:2148 length:1173 start_codon:yes stop_codon:yes gene_type:complete